MDYRICFEDSTCSPRPTPIPDGFRSSLTCLRILLAVIGNAPLYSWPMFRVPMGPNRGVTRPLIIEALVVYGRVWQEMLGDASRPSRGRIVLHAAGACSDARLTRQIDASSLPSYRSDQDSSHCNATESERAVGQAQRHRKFAASKSVLIRCGAEPWWLGLTGTDRPGTCHKCRLSSFYEIDIIELMLSGFCSSELSRPSLAVTKGPSC